MIEFDNSLLIYLLGLAVVWGTMITKINVLEKKMEKHNNLVERTYLAEASVKAAHKRLDDLHGEIELARAEGMEAKEASARALGIIRERGLT